MNTHDAYPPEDAPVTELVIQTRQPQALAAALAQNVNNARVVDDSFNGTTCVVRVLGDTSLAAHVASNYGKIVLPRT